MDFEKMSFRTPNYGDSMMGSLLNLQMSGVLCDAILKGRNVEAKVHRVILMALDCPYFKEQLVTTDLNTIMESPSIVEIDTESQVDLDCFVKELYTGCLELKTSNVRNMSNIYETLKMNNQLQFCHDFEKRLLQPPEADAILNDSSPITGLDTLDVSKVSAVVCSGSDIIKVIKVETSDDEEIHVQEASKNDSETPGHICMKSEDVKDEEPISDVQKMEVKETSTLEKEECEETDKPKSSADPEENLTTVANTSEAESPDDSTVKSENEDDDDGMDGFEVVDEYIEDEEQTDDPPPAKKPKELSLSKFACATCEKEFSSRGSLRNHLVLHSDPKHKCNLCEKSFYSSHSLAKHLFVHSGDSRHVCATCGSAFQSSYNLRRHENEVHNKTKLYECGSCGKRFSRTEVLKAHQVSHSKIDTYRHSLCNKTYRYRSTLNRHKCKPKVYSFSCDVCLKEFSSSKYLRQHKLKHAEPKYQCDTCGRQFTWKTCLTRHQKSCNL